MVNSWESPEERKPLTRKQIADIFIRQQGLCPKCGQKLNIKGNIPVDFIDEHVTPLWSMGSNDINNRQLWCKPCAKVKTSAEAKCRGKTYRIRDRNIGAKKAKNPMRWGKNSLYKKKISGKVVLRD